MSAISETYGEILPESVSKLLSEIILTANDRFVDLGSGKGKVVLQVFATSSVKEAHGIEIMPKWHEQALQVEQQLRVSRPDLFTHERSVTFTLGDILSTPFQSATIALIGSPCYSPTILNSLASIIDRTPGIHTVLSLRPLLKLQRLSFIRTIRVECSWDTALCYVYR